MNSKKFVATNILLLSVIGLTACGQTKTESSISESSSSAISETVEASVSESPDSSASIESEAVEEQYSSSESTEKSSFTQSEGKKDTSDTKIESIETYNDYLSVYSDIVYNYYLDYETVIKDTALYDAATWEQEKKNLDGQLQTQKEMYGSEGDKKIIGKEALVDYLKQFRNGLDDFIKGFQEGIQ